jgi:ABC-type transport system involved in multi-copper enzyme maturation permease subunit
MLVAGRAEFYLSKPMSRTSLIMNKLFGTFLAYGIIVVVFGLVGYASLYFVHGVSSPNLIWVFVLNMISLFIWLSITSFAGIVFGSTSMAIVTAALVWVAQLVLQGREFAIQLVDSKAVEIILDVLYYIVPNTGELSDITIAVAIDSTVTSWVPVWSSVAFAAVLLIITLVIFNKKNY